MKEQLENIKQLYRDELQKNKSLREEIAKSKERSESPNINLADTDQIIINTYKTLTVYRALKLEGNNYDKLTQLGQSWTTDYSKAYPYGYKSVIDTYFIYTAEVSVDDIDRDKTNACFFKYEREIVLKSGSPIQVTRIDKVTNHEAEKINILNNAKTWMYKKTIQTININYKSNA